LRSLQAEARFQSAKEPLFDGIGENAYQIEFAERHGHTLNTNNRHIKPWQQQALGAQSPRTPLPPWSAS
jgi:hypothetical protein